MPIICTVCQYWWRQSSEMRIFIWLLLKSFLPFMPQRLLLLLLLKVSLQLTILLKKHSNCLSHPCCYSYRCYSSNFALSFNLILAFTPTPSQISIPTLLLILFPFLVSCLLLLVRALLFSLLLLLVFSSSLMYGPNLVSAELLLFLPLLPVLSSSVPSPYSLLPLLTFQILSFLPLLPHLLWYLLNILLQFRSVHFLLLCCCRCFCY